VSPAHHPEAERLVDYAAGTITGGARLVMASHLGACAVCHAAVSDLEAVGGVLLGRLPPADLHPDALSLALARIERPAPLDPSPVSPPAGWIQVPDAVSRAFGRRRWAAPGVWVAPVTRGPGAARGYLLGVASGMGVPRHTHRGGEMICVLKGAYRDGEALHRPGDFARNDEQVEHRPRATNDGECVCLIATDNPLVARDWIGRIFQPIVGI
jgi:putative transcriptional regulator